MGAETSQSLERGLRLLRLLADAPSPMTVTALADALQTHRPVVYRLITALARQGMVHRDADGRWRLGLGVLHLAQRLHPLLRDAAAGPLRRLAEDVGATAHLTIADGEEALAVAVIEPSWTDYHVAYRVGSRHPLDRGAAGLAILALGAATEPGYQATSGELQPGAHGIAAPVTGVSDLRASVGVITLGELAVDEVGERVIRAADEIRAALS
ncbi:MAG: helix-turn-helix domain-containing protein [Geodermatophilaceae bacterium]|nr:helix-turn-helix domain-containing protein [Geodermatophilaceae bacterium]